VLTLSRDVKFMWRHCLPAFGINFVSGCGLLNLDSKENKKEHTHTKPRDERSIHRESCLENLLSLILLSLHEVARIIFISFSPRSWQRD
jgi:hypothetical protein